MALQATDPEIRDFLVEKQAEWAADSRTTTVETNKKWFTYAVAGFPRGRTDFHGNKLDSGSVVNDEIEIQTGLKPVDPHGYPCRQKPIVIGSVKHTGAIPPSAPSTRGLSADVAARLATLQMIVLSQNNVSTASALTAPTFTSAQLAQGKSTASLAD
ncbi:hypothetical protein FOPG_17123 [Fusarium oxysporum f. sp. conglutinans race 2 54008]|uniref:Uncharacterized protein n=1 Tax=Fusarium oxysporum f. sp. conglutinans race 2 54008 TaxID=1089457 RepID=X0GTM1_FUSOX|nr:hypothetical protein FOPG_17123 [Fusarium oxysporum f. sp. conglutinans race 2 54008]